MHGCPPALFFVADCRAGLTGGVLLRRGMALSLPCAEAGRGRKGYRFGRKG